MEGDGIGLDSGSGSGWRVHGFGFPFALGLAFGVKRLHGVIAVSAGQRIGVMFWVATDVVHMSRRLLEMFVSGFDMTSEVVDVVPKG